MLSRLGGNRDLHERLDELVKKHFESELTETCTLEKIAGVTIGFSLKRIK